MDSTQLLIPLKFTYFRAFDLLLYNICLRSECFPLVETFVLLVSSKSPFHFFISQDLRSGARFTVNKITNRYGPFYSQFIGLMGVVRT